MYRSTSILEHSKVEKYLVLMSRQLNALFIVGLSLLAFVSCLNMEYQLMEDLLHNYNKISRPVKDPDQNITVKFGASLIRIIDVDEKNQVFTTNLWLDMRWPDSKLIWNPEDYGGLTKIHIPSEYLWTPDIVLYNNAAGDPQITIQTDAVVYSNGTVVWKPPAIYKSFCKINVLWFPYDSQQCEMKFGAWTYYGNTLDLRQLPEDKVKFAGIDKDNYPVFEITIGMDLSYYYLSAEWDLLELKSHRHEKVYSSCCGPYLYVDITFYFLLRRKTLFYTVNLIIPCFLISVLTTLVFYSPDHKITFAISILVTLTVFFLVLIDNVPPTSEVIPMFGQYLMFTIILVTLSIMISVITVNFRFRRGPTHKLPRFTRKLFLQILPKILLMKRPKLENHQNRDTKKMRQETTYISTREPLQFRFDSNENLQFTEFKNIEGDQNFFTQALSKIRFISNYFQKIDNEDQESDEWIYVAMVIDRLFLIIYSIFNLGTLFFILRAPSLSDTTKPLDIPNAHSPLGQG